MIIAAIFGEGSSTQRIALTSKNAYIELLADINNVIFINYRIKHSDGRWLWLETYGKVVERDNDNRLFKSRWYSP
ncbi:PAS domain-containing protein [Vibrio tritonius]|uniref:PAS domain-containing protein n=1 Tax=Vibrio tritonius TaxID=1435069 RepID=UPI003CCA27E2